MKRQQFPQLTLDDFKRMLLREYLYAHRMAGNNITPQQIEEVKISINSISLRLYRPS